MRYKEQLLRSRIRHLETECKRNSFRCTFYAMLGHHQVSEMYSLLLESSLSALKETEKELVWYLSTLD